MLKYILIKMVERKFKKRLYINKYKIQPHNTQIHPPHYSFNYMLINIHSLEFHKLVMSSISITIPLSMT